MLNKDTLIFLENLKKNNNREWFAQNKSLYERALQDLEILVTQMIQSISIFDPEIGRLDPKKCIFRIYRDVRFSLDKSPYKTHFGIVFRPRTAERISGYYLHIDPQEIFLSYGYYMSDSEQLKKIRKGIYDDFDTLSEILNEKTFRKEVGDLFRDEDALKRVPNGFDKKHPAAEYLKLKHFYVLKSISREELLNEGFVAYASEIYKIMQPFGQFLDDILMD